jgi:predicted helicase
MFRGMRQSLLQTFDEIHVVNLHGNSLKKETCPDGAKDENVFDIRQGVAICVMVKRRSDVDEPPTQGEQDAHPNASVRHADLWGVRQAKYDWLDRREVGNTRWSEIVPAAPLYLFTPRSRRASRYDTFPSLPAIFPVNSVGIVTARDHFVIDLDLAALKRRIATFRNKGLSDELVAKMLQLKDNRDWKLADKRRAIQTDEKWDEKFTNILYRPFDIRHIFYHREAIDFGREEVMRHMTRANVALICPRQHKFEFGALATACVGGHKTVAAFDINYYFPLYLYPPAPQPDGAPRSRGRFVHLMLFEPHEEYGGRKPNLPDWLLGALAKAYGKETSPEDVFHYIYAVLYSPAYREKYAEFLKSDFPRIPFTADADMFRRMAAIGAKLTALHLLRSPALDSAAVGFHGKGDNRVAKNRAAGRTYDARNRRVYINKEQYFDRIGAGLWAYQIGGYQVLDKWLKDRAERRLSAEDVRHYCRIVGALSETLRAQRELTKLYPSVEKGLIAIEAK